MVIRESHQLINQDSTQEVWKKVYHNPIYEVSNLGNIRSYYGKNGVIKATPKLLNPGFDRDGYRKIILYGDGKRTHCKVAKLVAEAFLGKRPEGLVICHIDGNESNDCVSNLEYKTQKENIADKKRHGTFLEGARHHLAKLTEEQVKEIYLSTDSVANLADRHKISRSQICAIRGGREWASVTKQLKN